MPRICTECKQSNFYSVNGQYVCSECHTCVADYVETVYDEFQGPSQGRSNKTAVGKKMNSKKKDDLELKNKLILSWDLYDGFNFILVKMTDALIKCGADPEIKSTVHKLWASYLSKMEIAFFDDPAASKNGEAAADEQPDEEQPSIIPAWFSQNPEEQQDSPIESDYQQPRKPALFAPKKIPKRKSGAKNRINQMKALLDAADADLSIVERRRKQRKIKSNFIKTAVSGGENDVSRSEASATSADETIEEKPLPRLQTREKNDLEIMKKTTELGSEYMTLQKLLSFLHAALLMTGHLITYGDLTRWVREGFIPFYGAHQLLPETMPLTRSDAQVLGLITAKANGAPCSVYFRQSTARILHMLGYETIPKPPAYVVASKIIVDLQLPNELEIYVRTMDRIINKGIDDKAWTQMDVGSVIKSESLYAGSLVLASVKLIFGLDGITEDKISDFAEQANNLLKLKPSSSFARRKGSENVLPKQSSMGVKTLFVWKDWVRFIEYRRLAMERNHVPTAIRKGLVKKMDPDYVLRFAQNEGYYHCHRPADGLQAFDKSILEILERAKTCFPSPPGMTAGPPKRIPTFKPSMFGMHGLAEQLLEFDSLKYGQLKQEFSISSLVFSWKLPQLAGALKKANPPHRINVNKGSAKKEMKLTMPFVSNRNDLSRKNFQGLDRYAFQIIKVESKIIPALPDEDDKVDESEPSLLLYDPSSSYWIASMIGLNITLRDWNLFSAALPPTFLWMLNLICESIEEQPRDFYEVFSKVEAIVFLHHGKVKRSLSNKEDIMKRIRTALRAEF